MALNFDKNCRLKTSVMSGWTLAPARGGKLRSSGYPVRVFLAVSKYHKVIGSHATQRTLAVCMRGPKQPKPASRPEGKIKYYSAAIIRRAVMSGSLQDKADTEPCATSNYMLAMSAARNRIKSNERIDSDFRPVAQLRGVCRRRCRRGGRGPGVRSARVRMPNLTMGDEVRKMTDHSSTATSMMNDDRVMLQFNSINSKRHEWWP